MHSTILSLLFCFLSCGYVASEASEDRAWYSDAGPRPTGIRNPSALAGKTAVDLCQLTFDAGGCTQELIRYYYDPKDDECKRFVFNGCGGNSNRFMRRSHCRNRCVKNKSREAKEESESANAIEEAKHRRMLTTTQKPTTTTTPSTTTTTTTSRPPVTRPVVKMNLTKITPNIRGCPHCDPLFGICQEDGKCGCVEGYKKLGNICIDVNECDTPVSCPPNSRCVNTIGSYRCDCDAGFADSGRCDIGPEACEDPFDIMLTEQDCMNGEQQLRFYFDIESASCVQFFYGGCESKSKNLFLDAQTCDSLCAHRHREYLRMQGLGSAELKDPPSHVMKETAQEAEDNLHPLQIINHHLKESKPIPQEIQRQNDESQAHTQAEAPVKFEELDLTPGREPTLEEKKEEAGKIVDIMKTSNPNDTPCRREFDEVLRLECMSAHWEEKFFFNLNVKECEPFWYDISCDPRDIAGKNFFDDIEKCRKTCKEDVPKEVVPPIAPSRQFSKLTDPVGIIPSITTTVRSIPFKPIPVNPKEPDNFAPKSHTDRFDRDKFMEEFKKKLTALPKDYKIRAGGTLNLLTATSKSETIPKPIYPGSSNFLPFASQMKLERQLPPLEPIPIVPRAQDHYELPKEAPAPMEMHQSIVEEMSAPTSRVLIKNPTEKYISQEKIKIDKTLKEMEKKVEICDEPLDVKLEEDCLHETWVVRVYFDKEKGSCRTFWYGGCTSNARNFFLDMKACKKACGHRYAVQDDHLSPRYLVSTVGSATEQEPHIPVSTSTTTSAPIDLFPQEQEHVNENLIYHQFQPEPQAPPKNFVSKAQPPVPLSPKPSPILLHKIPPPFIVESTQTPREVTHFQQRNVDSAPVRVETTVQAQPHAPSLPEIHEVEPGRDIPQAPPKPVEENDIFSEFKQEDRTEEDGQIVKVPIEERPTVLEENNSAVGDPCEDSYDEKWDEDCAGDDWVVRAWFDESSGGCKRFWWGGCAGFSRNMWKDQDECRTKCGHKMTPPKPFAPYVEASSAPKKDVAAAPPEVAAAPDASLTAPEVIATSRTGSHPPIAMTIRAAFTTKSAPFVPDQENSHSVPAVPEAAAPEAAAPEAPENVVARDSPNDEPQHNVAFEVDIERKQAEIKREEEGREDLAYSKAVNHPVTVASECLETFDTSLTQSCYEGAKWKNRYYYDRDLRTCRMFWNDGCFSSSKNNFDDLETCQWKCEGRHPDADGRSCLDKFDLIYLDDCRHGEFTNRYYFDHDRKKCVSFHWGGCQSKSLNFYTDMGECEQLCETPSRSLTQACVEPFDHSYRETCSADGRHHQYYFFDHISHTCRMFWFGNCKGTGQNIFPSLEACQWICERHREERAPAHCADKFDVKYMESCGTGEWIEKWYFEQRTGECESFWWDGCTSSSQNIFPDEKTCRTSCEHPGYSIQSRLPDPETKFRCLEPVEIGSCRETYPAYYFDRSAKMCRPFAYSGCGGNGNRFLTLSQCENLCKPFVDMTEPEMDCYLPLHTGYGKNDDHCLSHASYRFYFDRDYGRCSQYWYLGCGGNANNFYSYEVCQRTCHTMKYTPMDRKPRESSNGEEPYVYVNFLEDVLEDPVEHKQ